MKMLTSLVLAASLATTPGPIARAVAREAIQLASPEHARSAGANGCSAIENKLHPCHCDDPGLVGALVGMPVGAIGGGVLGYYVSRHVAQEIIYRAP